MTLFKLLITLHPHKKKQRKKTLWIKQSEYSHGSLREILGTSDYDITISQLDRWDLETDEVYQLIELLRKELNNESGS